MKSLNIKIIGTVYIILCFMLTLPAVANITQAENDDEVMPVLTIKIPEHEVITKINQDENSNPFINEEVVSIRHKDIDVNNYLIDAGLEILGQAFIPEGIKITAKPIRWDDNKDINTTVALSLDKVGELIIINNDDVAAFSINIPYKTQDIVNKAKYFSFIVKPTINYNFAVRLNFHDPITGIQYSKKVDFPKKLIDYEKSLVVINFSKLYGEDNNNLISVGFFFDVANFGWFPDFPDAIAAYISEINFIREEIFE